MVWPAATRAGVQHVVDQILTDNVTYPNGDSDKARFLRSVAPYHRLSETADYQALNVEIEKSLQGKKERGRFVYMSVPPKFFGSISREISNNLRPKAQDTFLKVIVEKPFGTDLNSAMQLSRDLFNSLKEHEVLCVDHYMGKDGLRGIREFRVQNPDYINHSLIRKIDHIQVQMVETEDCKGRTSFYDEVGVIRDTMQNHLMMMIGLFAMDGDTKDEEALRRSLTFKDIEALTSAEAVEALGQYEDYNKHIQDDYLAYYGKPMESAAQSVTPTYARVMLRFRSSSHFRGIPIMFVSGKALPKRRAFFRVVLKGESDALTFSVQGDLETLGSKKEKLSGAYIHATAGLAGFKCPDGWTQKTTHHCEAPKSTPNAYQVILKEGLSGRFESFVSIAEILQSWRVWTPLLELDVSKTKMLSYKAGGAGLDDELNGGSKPGHEEL